MYNIPDSIDPLVWIILGFILAAGIYNLYRNRQRKDDRGDWHERYLTTGDGSRIALLRYRQQDYPDPAWVDEHVRTLSWIHGQAWPFIVPTWSPETVVGDHISLVECYPHPIELDGPEVEAAKIEVGGEAKIAVVTVGCGEGKASTTHADGVMVAGLQGCKILLRTFQNHHDGGAFAHELIHVGQWYLARAGTDHEAWTKRHYQIAKTYRSRL